MLPNPLLVVYHVFFEFEVIFYKVTFFITVVTRFVFFANPMNTNNINTSGRGI